MTARQIEEEPETVSTKELKQLKEQASQLQELVAEKDSQLTAIGKRIDELNQTISGKDEEIKTLKESVTRAEADTRRLNSELKNVVASYKALVISTNPGIPEELLSGDSVEAINESLEKAKKLVDRVAQGLKAEASASRIPFGAPVRTAPDFSGLSSREKIKYAIGGN